MIVVLVTNIWVKPMYHVDLLLYELNNSHIYIMSVHARDLNMSYSRVALFQKLITKQELIYTLYQYGLNFFILRKQTTAHSDVSYTCAPTKITNNMAIRAQPSAPRSVR